MSITADNKRHQSLVVSGLSLVVSGFSRIFFACLVASACANERRAIDEVAEGYVRTALQLAQHDRQLVEAWRGPASWRPGPRVPVAELLPQVITLQERLDRFADEDAPGVERARHRYLLGQLAALRFAAERQLGRATSVDEQAREEFALRFEALDGAHAERARDRLAKLLPGTKPLADRVAALRLATTIPRDRQEPVMQMALAACRDATSRVLRLPPNESVSVVFKPGLDWDGYARYAGHDHSDIEINGDAPLDISRALRLACHEGYPGHHLQHLLIDRLFMEHRWPELQLTPGFGRHLLLAEGAAEVGADLAMTAAARQSFYRDALFPAAGVDPSIAATLVLVEDTLVDLLPVVTDVARAYLAGAIAQERALERLRDEALVANPAATLAFIERRRARALVYGEGRRIVLAMMPARDLEGLRAAFQAPAALQ